MNTTSRFSSMTLAALLTLAMLMGVNSLARVDAPAAQLAQAASTRA